MCLDRTVTVNSHDGTSQSNAFSFTVQAPEPDQDCGKEIGVHNGIRALSNGKDSGLPGKNCGDGPSNKEVLIERSNQSEADKERFLTDLYGSRFQCVEYVRAFYTNAMGMQADTQWPRPMNAGEFYDRYTDLGLERYANFEDPNRPTNKDPEAGKEPPREGDILVFKNFNKEGKSVGGHVAIIRSVEDKVVNIIEQNWTKNSGNAKLTLNRPNGRYQLVREGSAYKILGWLRRPGTTQPPTPPPVIDALLSGTAFIDTYNTGIGDNPRLNFFSTSPGPQAQPFTVRFDLYKGSFPDTSQPIFTTESITINNPSLWWSFVSLENLNVFAPDIGNYWTLFTPHTVPPTQQNGTAYYVTFSYDGTEHRIGSNPPPASGIAYQILDLGTLGGISSRATGINDSGQIVGSSTTGSSTHAFLYTNGAMEDLGTLGGIGSAASAINNLGEIVGIMGTTSGAPFIYTNGTMQYLGISGGISADDINDNAQVVGTIRLTPAGPPGTFHPYIYNNGTIQDLGTLGGQHAYATGINNNGDIVGYSQLLFPPNFSTSYYSAFLYSNGVMQNLGSFGGEAGSAYGINNLGDVVGFATTSEGAIHAFLYSDGVMQDINGGSDSENSVAVSINDNREIVGNYISVSKGEQRAFVYRNGSFFDLNELIDPESGWLLTEANGINSQGQVVGVGIINEQDHAYLASPINSTGSVPLTCGNNICEIQSGESPFNCTADCRQSFGQ
jgi:probable HAF family extracellular repeat protein